MIKYLIMDVDGTLTDGKIYMGPNGETMKAFSVKDGYVFNYILKPAGIVPIIVTARKSEIVKKRCDELGIKEVFQGIIDKLSLIQDIIGKEKLSECAYFGDDVLDLNCMKPIKEAGGIVGCPADAVKEVTAFSDYVCDSIAGKGALREFSEWLVDKDQSNDQSDKKIEEAIKYLLSLDVTNISIDDKFVVNDDFFFSIQSYKTKPITECILESHKKYVDIQVMVKGTETMYLTDTARNIERTAYDEIHDIITWNLPNRMAKIILHEGDYLVLYPENAHMGAVNNGECSDVIKIVGKIRL